MNSKLRWHGLLLCIAFVFLIALTFVSCDDVNKYKLNISCYIDNVKYDNLEKLGNNSFSIGENILLDSQNDLTHALPVGTELNITVRAGGYNFIGYKINGGELNDGFLIQTTLTDNCNIELYFETTHSINFNLYNADELMDTTLLKMGEVYHLTYNNDDFMMIEGLSDNLSTDSVLNLTFSISFASVLTDIKINNQPQSFEIEEGDYITTHITLTLTEDTTISFYGIFIPM